MGQDAAGRAEQQSHCGDGTQAARVRRAPAACLAAVAGPSRERAHFTGTPRPREDSRTPGLRASRSLALVAPLSFGDRGRRPRGSDWPHGVAVTPRRGPKAADGMARVRGGLSLSPEQKFQAQRPALFRAWSSTGRGAESGARPDALGTRLGGE